MKPRSSTKAFQRAAGPASKRVVLRLYISGSSDLSLRALRNAKEICEAHLAGTYELDVVDIYKQPELAREDNVVAVPALVRRRPLPRRLFIGDLSDRDGVVAGLGLALERKSRR